MPAPTESSPAGKGKRPQWSSPWLIGFVLVSALYLTGFLDKGFLYLERLYFAPWSLGDGALTGAWEGAVSVGDSKRRMLLTIGLRTRSRFDRTTRRNNIVASSYLWIAKGEVQLLGNLTVCPNVAEGNQAELEQYELSGQANGKASDVELSSSSNDRDSRFGFESLSGAWRPGGVLSWSVVHTVREGPPSRRNALDADERSAPARKRTDSVMFRKLKGPSSAAHC